MKTDLYEVNTTTQVLFNNIGKLENVFVKHYAPNHMPDPKGGWSLKENNSELHYRNIQKLISSSTFRLNLFYYIKSKGIGHKLQKH